ncbi:MAG: flagellar hook-basal body complex protein [Beijerinckiaceae bacterium]
MENALLIGLSRQVALARELDVVANNVANVDTNGFKRRGTIFQEYLAPTARHEHFKPGADRRLSYVWDRGTALQYSQGTMERTSNPLDLAISGDALFAVRSGPGGERYTRNGSLGVNAKGELVNSDGHVMVTDQGSLTLSPTETDLKIGADGSITTSNGPRGRLKLVAVPNPQVLRNEGSNLFSTAVPLQAAQPRDARLMVGEIEKSNVKPVLEISRLMELSRAYQNVASLMQRTDEIRRGAITRLADTNPNA